MPWICFERAFDWNPTLYKGRVTVHFKKGKYLVPRKCAEEAFKAEAAKLIMKGKEDDNSIC